MDSSPPTLETSTCTAALEQEHVHEYLHLPKNVLEHIFAGLSPRDLSLASGVASSWRATAFLAPWDTFYAQRWPITPLDSSRAAYTSWHTLFSSRMTLARSFKGRPQLDRLSGHTSGIKVAKILSESDLLLTGSVDRRLALWDLETGTRLATSLQHAGTVRSLAIDDDLLVTGSSDHRIRVWRPRKESFDQEDVVPEIHQDTNNNSNARFTRASSSYSSIETRRREFPYHIEGARTVLAGGHTGPVTALELAPNALFSGSWDYCVRVWDRNSNTEEDEDGGGGGGGGDGIVNDQNIHTNNPSLQCVQVLHFDDMVTDMAFKRAKLFVAAGAEAHMVDAGAGGGLKKLSSFHRHASNSIVTAVEASEDERYLFYCTAEGGVYACDVRDPRHRQYNSSTTTPGCVANMTGSTSSGKSSTRSFDPGFSCSSAVTGLSWDFPWLAASLQNGEILLLNAESTLLGGGYGGNNSHNNKYTSSFNNASSSGFNSASGSGTGRSNAGASGSGVSSIKGREQHQQQQQQQQSSRWPSRALTAGVPGGAQCVDICGKWLVAGYESGCIVSWDFSRAEEAERAAEALRIGRRKKREQRRQNAKNKKQQGGQQRGREQDEAGPSNAISDMAGDNNNKSPMALRHSLEGASNQDNSGGGGSDGSGERGGSGEGQRGRERWHVLRMGRSNSTPSV